MIYANKSGLTKEELEKLREYPRGPSTIES